MAAQQAPGPPVVVVVVLVVVLVVVVFDPQGVNATSQFPDPVWVGAAHGQFPGHGDGAARVQADAEAFQRHRQFPPQFGVVLVQLAQAF